MDIFEELKNKKDCHTSYMPEKITRDDVEKIENEAVYVPNRDDLYSLISEVHDLFVKAAEENNVSYDTSTDYYEGKAFAYKNAAYIIEEKMKKLYTPLACPSEGSFVGWKKAIFFTNSIRRGECLVKLEILADSKRLSTATLKCRCNKAKVLDIIALNNANMKISEAVSQCDHNFVYRVGEIVSVDNYDDDRWNECAPGIHFFINKQDAIDY